jgi:hypothetical protein
LDTNNLTTSNDRIEVRIDPATNALLNAGTLANVSGVKVYSGESAAPSSAASARRANISTTESAGLAECPIYISTAATRRRASPSRASSANMIR